MAASFVVACSNCSAKLKLKDKSMIGKKVRCPKCSEPFVIKASAKPKSEPTVIVDDGGFYDDPDEDEWGNDFGETSDDLDFAPAPRKKKRGKKSKKGSKKKGRNQEKEESEIPKGVVAALVGGGLVFLLMMGTGIFFLLSFLQGNEPVSRMQWLPNDTQTYVEIRVSEIWKAPVLKPIRTTLTVQKIKKQLADEGELGFEDIEKIVFGIPANGGEPMWVLYSKKNIDPKTLSPDDKATTYAGYQIYQSGDGQQFHFLVNSKTAVSGPRDSIHAAIDRKGECAVAADFEFLPEKGDVIFASLSPNSALQQSPAGMMTQSIEELEKLKIVSGVLDLTNDLGIDLTLGFEDTTTAQAVLTKAEEGLAKIKEKLDEEYKKLEGGNAVVNRMERSINLKSKNVVSTVELSGAENDFSVKLSISGSIFEDLIDMSHSLSGKGGGGFIPGMGGPF